MKFQGTKNRGFTTGCRMDGSTSHCSLGDLSAEKWMRTKQKWSICGSAIRKSMAHPRKKSHYYVPQMDAKWCKMMQMDPIKCLSESQAPLSVPPFLHKQQPAILRGRQQWLKKGYQVVPVNLQKAGDFVFVCLWLEICGFKQLIHFIRQTLLFVHIKMEVFLLIFCLVFAHVHFIHRNSGNQRTPRYGSRPARRSSWWWFSQPGYITAYSW